MELENTLQNITLVILVIVIIYLLYKNTQENFAAAPTLTLDTIKDEINKQYNMDIEAMRNLGAISKSLLTGTNYHSTSVGKPGDLTIPADNTNLIGGLTLKNTSWAKTNTDSSVGHIVSDNTGDKTLMIVGNNSAGGVRKVGIWDRLDVYGDTSISGNTSISSGLTVTSNSNIGGNIQVNGNSTVKGTSNVNGNLTVEGNMNIRRNKARYIRVGNNLAQLINREDYWTLLELAAYDINGNNIALNKPVTIRIGSAYCGTAQNIVNGNALAGDDICGQGYHGNAGVNELQIDLGGEYYIAQIILYARYNGSYVLRLNGTTIELLDAGGGRTRIIHTGNWLSTYSKEYLL